MQVSVMIKSCISARMVGVNWSSFIALLLTASTHLDQCEGLPGGAPKQACSTLSPDPASHGAPPQTSPVPYEISLTDFDDDTGSLSYIPGQTYLSMCTLEGYFKLLCFTLHFSIAKIPTEVLGSMWLQHGLQFW